jgi:CheY-like chemotaxis protein
VTIPPRSITLLNVEDYEPSRFLRTRLFRGAGFTVVEAASAKAALATAIHQPLSVALIDVHLPDGSGITLCETLKRLNPQLPVLLISAVSASEEIQQAGLAAGARAYLGEPVPSDLLLRSVTDALEPEGKRTESDTWITTDLQGFILDLSRDAARLLSGTARGLQHRSLLLFFDRDRDAWQDAMTRAARGDRIFRAGRIRPRERKPVPVRAEIQRTSDDRPAALVWNLRADN